MAPYRSATGTGSSCSDPISDGPIGDAASIVKVLRVMESQQQTALLREGLITVQQIATTAPEKVAAPRETRPGIVSNFRRLQPAVFSGEGTPLEVE